MVPIHPMTTRQFPQISFFNLHLCMAENGLYLPFWPAEVSSVWPASELIHVITFKVFCASKCNCNHRGKFSGERKCLQNWSTFTKLNFFSKFFQKYFANWQWFMLKMFNPQGKIGVKCRHPLYVVTLYPVTVNDCVITKRHGRSGSLPICFTIVYTSLCTMPLYCVTWW